jgi:FKBP-type peptidyl-prolyl cis-trans isomerase 2
MKHDRREIQTFLRQLPKVLGCLLILTGCATQGANQTLQSNRATTSAPDRHIQPGDTASVHYLCRLGSGEVVASTDSVAESQPKSNIYVLQEDAGPLSISAASTADSARAQGTPYEQRSLEEEISNQLSFAVVGMKEGDTRTTEIKAEDAPAQDAHKYIARLTRIRTRPKEMKMPKGDYEYRTHRSPEVGQEYSYDPAFPGKVVYVSEQEVTIRFYATPGTIVETPFGLGRIRDAGQNYTMDIEAHKGALVRAASMVGRISDVDDKVITVDFGNPFGGEALLCDVTIEKITDAKLVQSGK